MDIQVPYNIERILFWYADGNTDQVARWMHAFKTTGQLAFTPEQVKDMREKLGISSSSSTDDEVKKVSVPQNKVCQCDPRVHQTIAQMYQQSDGYVLDPHTAVGVTVANARESHPHLVVCMACAHPFKFEETIADALGQLPASLAAKDHLHPSVASAMQLRTKNPEMIYWPRTENWEEKLRRILQDMVDLDPQA